MGIFSGGNDIDIQVRLRDARKAAAEAKMVKGGIDDIGNASSTMGTKSVQASKKVSVLRKGLGALATFTKVGVVGAMLALGASLKVGYDEMQQHEKVAAQTTAVLKSTAGAAGVTQKHIESLANSILNKTGIDDEEIQSNENLLLTFTNLKNEAGKGNDIFDQSTKAVVDMSAALGQSGKSSAIMLGKALNDPIKGASALRRVGVSLTEQQEEQIKSFVESGHTLQAQKVILKELNKEFGGSAEAIGKTLPGKINILKETFMNLAGEGMEAIAPALTTALGAVSRFVQQLKTGAGFGGKVARVFKTIAGVVGEFVTQMKEGKGAGGTFVKILTGIWKVARNVWEFLYKVAKAEWEAVGGIEGIVSKAMFVKTIAVQAFQWLMNAVHNLVTWVTTAYHNFTHFVMSLIPVKIALLAIYAVIRVLIPVGKLVGWILGQMWVAAIHVVMGAFKVLWGVIKVFATIVSGVVSVWSHLLRGDFVGAAQAAVDTVKGVFHGLVNIVKTIFQTIKGEFTDFVGYVKQLPGKLANAGKGLFNFVKDSFRSGLNWVIEKWNNFSVSLPKVDLGPLGSVGGQTINFPDIPMLAQGGTITRSGSAVVGDAGPEILRLPRAARVEPLVAPTPTGAGLDGHSGGRPERVIYEMHTHVHLDGKEISENVTQHSEDELARR